MTAEKHEFRTELKELLHIITHSLYSSPDIFLRELISNAADAINRIKFDALSHEDLLEDNKDWKIKLIPDAEKGTLTISDNGIGMSSEDAVRNLGTIAHSGTRNFLQSLARKEARPDMIGQFGVGFYAAFMVADRVTVVSRTAGDPANGVRWESDGLGEFTVQTVLKPRRGTDVILHLKPECRDFLSPFRLRAIVKKFSDFLEHPVVLPGEKGDETLNSQQALWLRGRSEVGEAEYTEFYKQLTGDDEPPAMVLHYTSEGANEYRVLLFAPGQQSVAMRFGGEAKIGPRLYVQRVLILDHCDRLLPSYLRFLVGVVDCADLPLNVSREILQTNPLLDKIQKDLTRAVLRKFTDLQQNSPEVYTPFFEQFGTILKEGVSRDRENAQKLAALLLFESAATPSGKFTTLETYTGAMSPEQKDIFYLIGETRGQIEHSPYLESVRSQGRDVLFLTDSIDEWVLPVLGEYRGHKLVALDHSSATKTEAPTDATFAPLLAYLKTILIELADVRLSARLTESACCLVTDEGAMSAHLERVLQRAGRIDPAAMTPRVLELNAAHPAVVALRDLHGRSAADPRCELFARVLLDEAILAEGSRLPDLSAFARRVNDLLVRSAGDR